MSSDAEFIGRLLPSVRVRDITLETLGGTIELESNPHIVEETTPLWKRAKLQNMVTNADAGAGDYALASGIDVLDLVGMTSNSQGAAQKLAITVTLSLYDEMASTDTAAQWFMSKDASSYVSAFVHQFTDPQIAEIYNKYQHVINHPMVMGGFHNLTSEDNKLTAEGYRMLGGSVNDYSTLVAAVERGTWKMIGYPASDVLNSIPSESEGEGLTESDLQLAGYVSLTDSGGTAYDIPMTFAFECSEYTPNYLAIAAGPMLNFLELFQDYGLSPQNFTAVNKNMGQFSPAPLVEVVKNGTLQTNTGVISDFRDTEDQSPVYELDTGFDALAPSVNSYDVRGELSKAKRRYFGEIGLTRNQDGHCSFMFAYDHYDFVLHNSVYGHMLKNVKLILRDSILKKCLITNIKILRRRVKKFDQGSYARGYPDLYEPSNRNGEEEVHIVSSRSYPGGSQEGRLQPTHRKLRTMGRKVTIPGSTTERTVTSVQDGPSQHMGGLRELTNVDVKLLETSGGTPMGSVFADPKFHVRHFVGTDASVAKRTNGMYQYGVEIEVRDKIPEILSGYMNDLRTWVKHLKEYERFANIPVVNRLQFEAAEPHTDRVSQGPIPTSAGNYDPKINKFTTGFLARARSYLGDEVWHFHPSDTRTTTFYYLVDWLTGDVDPQSIYPPEKIAQLMHPEYGTPRGIAAVIKVFETWLGHAEKLISTVPPTTNAGSVSNANTGGRTAGSGTRPLMKCEHWFNNDAFNRDEVPNAGFSYNNPSQGVTITAPTIVSTQKMKQRFEYEWTKHKFEKARAQHPSVRVMLSPIKVFGLAGSQINLSSFPPQPYSISVETTKDGPVKTINKTATYQTDFNRAVDLVRFLASRKTAGDVKDVIALDEKRRPGNALAAEMGVSLITAQEAQAMVANTAGASADAENQFAAFSAGGDDGFSGSEMLLRAASFGAGLGPTLSIMEVATEDGATPLQREEVFPSAYPSDLYEQDIDLKLGFESADETQLLLSIASTTDRNLMHTTTDGQNTTNTQGGLYLENMTLLFEILELLGMTVTMNELLRDIPASLQRALNNNLAGSGESFGSEKWNDPLYNILYTLHFLCNVRVEYLHAYKQKPQTTGHQMQLGVSSEQWTALTRQKINQLHVKEGKTLICRLRPYNSTFGKIRFPKALDMPIFNSRFLLIGNNGKVLNSIRNKWGGQSPTVVTDTQGVFRK